MSSSITTRALAASVLAVALSAAPASAASEHEVRMLNRGEAGTMVFEPRILHIEPGDSVRFVPGDRGHSTESIDGMAPAGGPSWRGRIDEEVTVTFDVEGVYGMLCRPHQSMGMVGLIVVGDPSINLEEAKAINHRGRPARVFEELFAELEDSL